MTNESIFTNALELPVSFRTARRDSHWHLIRTIAPNPHPYYATYCGLVVDRVNPTLVENDVRGPVCRSCGATLDSLAATEARARTIRDRVGEIVASLHSGW